MLKQNTLLFILLVSCLLYITFKPSIIENASSGEEEETDVPAPPGTFYASGSYNHINEECQDENGIPSSPFLMGASYATQKKMTNQEDETSEKTIQIMPDSCFSQAYTNIYNNTKVTHPLIP